jgi:hypothetical protein
MGASSSKKEGGDIDSIDSDVQQMMSPIFFTRTKEALGKILFRLKHSNSPMSSSDSIITDFVDSSSCSKELDFSSPADRRTDLKLPCISLSETMKYHMEDPRAPDVKRTPLFTKENIPRRKLFSHTSKSHARLSLMRSPENLSSSLECHACSKKSPKSPSTPYGRPK